MKAKQELGMYFTYEIGVRNGQKLIKTGLYTYLMHSSYLGGSLMHLEFASITLFGLCIVHTIAVVYRIRKEGKVLHQNFGKEFLQYRKERWLVFPFIC